MDKLISPVNIMISRNKKFILNLNQYRNTHFRILNNIKIKYKEYMKSQILKCKDYNKVVCLYTVYPKDKRGKDIGNICSIHEKFFEDAFVELGKLPDDNYHYIPLVIYRYGEIDKDNPRVEIEVLDLTKENLDKIFNSIYNIVE